MLDFEHARVALGLIVVEHGAVVQEGEEGEDLVLVLEGAVEQVTRRAVLAPTALGRAVRPGRQRIGGGGPSLDYSWSIAAAS